MTERRADVLYVPTRPRDHTDRVWVELRTLPDGRIALPAYTSLHELVRSRGQHQAWIGLDSEGMSEVARATRYDVVLIDADLSPLGDSSRADAGVGDDEPAFYAQSFMVDPLGR